MINDMFQTDNSVINSNGVSIQPSRDQYSSKEIADMVNAVLSFDNKKIIEPIKNALYTKPLKTDSVSLSSGLDIATDPFDFVLKFISSNNSSDLYDVESESYGVLYKYVRDKYIDSPSKIIDIDTGTRRYYSLQDYMITPVISYYGGPVASMRTPDNAHISDKDIILKYKEILYSLKEDLKSIVNDNLNDSFLRDLILPFIVEDPNKLFSDRELSKYDNSLLMTLDKSLIYGDDRDNMLLAILNSSYNYFGSANLDSNIDYFSRKIAVDAISDYVSYFGERGDDLKNTLSDMWNSIEYSAKKIASDTVSHFVSCFGEKDSKLKTMLSNVLSNITLNPIRYDIDYYYPDKASNKLNFFIDGTEVSSNLIDGKPHWKYINIISGNTYYENYVKKLDSGETVYKSKIYVKNSNGEYTVVSSFTGGIPDSIDDLNTIISDGTEIYVQILSDISIKVRGNCVIKYELSNDNEKYLINFETLSKNFFEIILECYNNSVLDTNKLADGYGTYSSYLDLLKMVSSDDYLFDNLSKIRLSEFIYILKDFYKIDENDPYIEALESKLENYYTQCSYIKNAYKIILNKFNKYPQYFKCIKI